MHFPDVEEIKDIVICDPQVVFDSVTELIFNNFTFEHVGKLASENLKKNGQFSLEDVQRIAKNSKSDSLPPPKLLKLLKYLNIIAPIKSEGGSPKSDEVFFMPAVLKHATEKELHMKQSSTDPVPLMIHFKCGFVPVGVFCAMIASLVSRKDLRWRVLEPKPGHVLYKNRATFRVNGAYNLTLISKPKWYEIYIARIPTKGRALEKMCHHVLETVCDTLDQVISKMKYKQYTTSSPCDPTLYELGFKCPEHPNNDHLVIHRPMSGEKAQSPKDLWLNYCKENPKSIMICPLKEQAIDLRDKRFSPPNSFPTFADRSLVWFGEAMEISSDSILAMKLDERNVLNLLHEAKFADGDWELFGQQLIDRASLITIRAKCHGDPSLCMIDTISQWLRTDSKPSWEKLVGAVAKVEQYGEATADIVREKAAIVHTAAEAIQSSQEGISSQLPLTSKVDTHVSIQGADNVGEMTLKVVSGKPLNYHWKGHGLRLHIPADALDPSTPPLIMRIQASLSGQFKLPDDMDLVSGVYWISFPAGVLKKPVTLELQHCAYLEQTEQTNLSFVTSKCNQPLPYQFKPLPGGVFTTSSDHGTVQLNHFSGVAVAKKGRRTQSHSRKQEGDTDDKSAVQRVEKKYLVLTYFTQARPTRTTWKMYFTIIPNLELHLKTVEKYYSKEEAESSLCKQVFFQMDKVTLDIPEAGFKLLNGWSIVPMTHPVSLMQTEVDNYVDSIPPSCQLELHFQKTEQPYEQLSYQIKVSGIQGISAITITRDVDPELRAAADILGKRKYEFERESSIGIERLKTDEVPKKRRLSDEPDPTVAYVEKPVTASKRKQTGGEEQEVPKKRHSSNVISAAATHTFSLATTDDGIPFPSSESPTSSNRDLEVQKRAEILDVNNITRYLHPLDKTAVFNLGIVLGLDYNRLKTMMDAPTFLQDMLAGWLERVDRVLEIGVPTWRRLAEALKDPRVGQNGLAHVIEQNE